MMMRRTLLTLAGLVAPVVAQAADVHIGIDIGVPLPPPPVVVAEPPPLLVVPQTRVYYAPDVPYNFFYYSGLYYTFHEGFWFSAGSFNGPWTYVALGRVPRPVLAVPVGYYKMPPGHWKEHGPPPWAGHHHDRGHGHGHHGHHD